MTGPIITGILQSIPVEVAASFGGRDRLPLSMLGRLRKEADGDCGIAFEYAVHDAVISREPIIAERLADALGKCGIGQGDPTSILIAIEKSGAQELVSTEAGLVMEKSPVLLGKGGRPVSLREHLGAISAAFRLPGTLLNLAQSFRGLWKTELFLGSSGRDQWVGASVNISQSQLTAAEGPRIAIIPSVAGVSDAVRLDEQKNVVICPVPHDGSFMKIFHEGWKIVQTLCASNFEMPGSSDIPNPLHREAARIFAERRRFPIVEVVDAIRKFAQPELLTTSVEIVPNIPFESTMVPMTSTIITPIARTVTTPGEKTKALADPARGARAS